MTDDRFGKQCPVCGKRITPEFLARHIGMKHPTFKSFVENPMGGKKK